jgi:hypothetical protein
MRTWCVPDDSLSVLAKLISYASDTQVVLVEYVLIAFSLFFDTGWFMSLLCGVAGSNSLSC